MVCACVAQWELISLWHSPAPEETSLAVGWSQPLCCLLAPGTVVLASTREVAWRGRSAGDEAKQSPSSSFLAQFQGQLCCRRRPSLLPAARWPGRGWRCRTGLQDMQGRLLSTTSAWGSAELSLAQCLRKCFDSLQALGVTGRAGSCGRAGSRGSAAPARCGAASVAGSCSSSSAICVLPGH